MSKAWDALTPEMQQDIAGPNTTLAPYTIESIIDRCTPRGPFPNSNIVATYKVREAALKALRESERELAKAVRLAFEGDLGALFAARNAVLKEKAKAGDTRGSFKGEPLNTSYMTARQCASRFSLPPGYVFLGRIIGTGHVDFAFDYDIAVASTGDLISFSGSGSRAGRTHDTTGVSVVVRRQWIKDGNNRSGLQGQRVQAVNGLAVMLYDTYFLQSASPPSGQVQHPRWPLPSGWIYTVAQSKSGRWWSCSCPGWIRHRHCKHLETMSLPGHHIPKEIAPNTSAKRAS